MDANLLTPADGTNYWDLLVISSVTGTLGVSAVGGITALATDIECHVQRFDTVNVCCSKEAPVPLVPIVAFGCAVLMIAIVWLRRTCGARAFQGFRAHAHQSAVAYGKATTEADKVKEIEKTQAVLALTAGKVKSNRAGLFIWAWVQLFMALGMLLAVFVALPLTVGDGIMLGGSGEYENQKGQNYYDFHCPSSCSVLSPPPTPAPTRSPTAPTAAPTAIPSAAPSGQPTALPTASPTAPTAAPTSASTPTALAPTASPPSPTSQPSTPATTTFPFSQTESPIPTTSTDEDFIRCRRKPESPGLFWTLVVALLLNVVGSFTFALFVLRVFPCQRLGKADRDNLCALYSPSCARHSTPARTSPEATDTATIDSPPSTTSPETPDTASSHSTPSTTSAEARDIASTRVFRCCNPRDENLASTSVFDCYCWPQCEWYGIDCACSDGQCCCCRTHHCSCVCCWEFVPGDNNDHWETERIIAYSRGDGRNLPFESFTDHLKESVTDKCHESTVQDARLQLTAQQVVLDQKLEILLTILWLDVHEIELKDFTYGKHGDEFKLTLARLEKAYALWREMDEKINSGATTNKKRLHDGDRIQALALRDRLQDTVIILTDKVKENGESDPLYPWLQNLNSQQGKAQEFQEIPNTIADEKRILLNKLRKLAEKVEWKEDKRYMPPILRTTSKSTVV